MAGKNFYIHPALLGFRFMLFAGHKCDRRKMASKRCTKMASHYERPEQRLSMLHCSRRRKSHADENRQASAKCQVLNDSRQRWPAQEDDCTANFAGSL